jgi:hypothetical protein
MIEDHRALMVSALTETGRVRSLGFMRAPADLQSEIVSLLDQRAVTFRQAARLCADRGFPIHHESLRSYYQALTHERRTFQLKSCMASAVRALEDVPTEQSIKALLHVLASALTKSLSESSVPVKDLDVARLISVLIEATAAKEKDDRHQGESHRGTLSQQEKRRRIREIYNL